MSRDQLLILISVAIPIALVTLGMVFGWRARRRRQADVAGLITVPADTGAPILAEDLLYVATTRADAPLDRIVVEGLGFRARARLHVSTEGVELDIAGQEPGFIPVASLLGVGRATWTIDRAISGDGLVFVRWSQRPGPALDSYFRSQDPAALVAAIGSLIPTATEAAA